VVEETIDVIEIETLEVGHDVRSMDTDDIIWTRRFDELRKYVRSEVKLLGMDVLDFFRVLVAGDSRFHVMAVMNHDLISHKSDAL
jgi:hypothetical protein